MIGLARVDMASITGAFLTNTKMPSAQTDDWWLGLVGYFIIGSVVLALGYVAASRFLRGPDWLKGLIWGLAMWLILEVAIMPLIGQGPFSSAGPDAMKAAFTALLGHVAYGVVLGTVAGREAAASVPNSTAAHV